MLLSLASAALPPDGKWYSTIRVVVLMGYAWVSMVEQILALQEDVLQAVGCEQRFTDTLSGAKAERSGLARCWPTCGRAMCWSSGASTCH